MSSYLALLRHDHLDEVLHMFAYLKLHANSDMIYDPRGIEFDRSGFPIKDWSYSIYTQYGCELSENIMPNITKPLGKGMVIMVDVDSDHTGDTVTMISRTGFFVLFNYAPIYWISKNQTWCETSLFVSGLCAMKQATEYFRGLRYKLSMMLIPVDEPTFVYGNNQSVLANTTMPGSTLKKKRKVLLFIMLES